LFWFKAMWRTDKQYLIENYKIKEDMLKQLEEHMKEDSVKNKVGVAKADEESSWIHKTFIKPVPDLMKKLKAEYDLSIESDKKENMTSASKDSVEKEDEDS